MDPQVSTTAARVFSQVLADFAFLFGDAVAPEELPRPEGKVFLAWMNLRGRLEGCAAVAVSEALAVEIAASTMGRESADPEAICRGKDAVREMASVLGGHLATALAEPGADVELTPPSVTPLDAAEWDRLRSDLETQCFVVNDHPVLLRVALQREAAGR
jgi:CheY-specific phosphatase CheX